MLLHLFDDEKVVNRTIEIFEKALPGKSIYICFIDEAPRFVRATDNLYFYKENDSFQRDILKDINKVIVHFFII